MKIPQWLDNYIFNELNARYCRSNADMTVIDWDKGQILNYLGTYFPRSYVESYSIFSEYFQENQLALQVKDSISILDFGCGTGGEIIGLITAIKECYPSIRAIEVTAIDGNHHALRLYDKISTELQERLQINIKNNVAPITIDDFYDLSILESILKLDYDFIISFKAICEFVTKQQFEANNPYEYITKTFLQKLKADGTMLLVDVTTYNNTSQEWLPIMMDKGLKKCNCRIIKQNTGYNQAYSVSHSQNISDISKVAWRMIKRI